MSSVDGMTPSHGDVVDFLVKHNPNWPFGPAMERLTRRYMSGTRDSSPQVSPAVQPDKTPLETNNQIISHHHAAGHETRDSPLCLGASSSKTKKRSSPANQPVKPASPPRLGNYDPGRRSSRGIVDPPPQASGSQRDHATSPQALKTLEHGPTKSPAIPNPSDQRPGRQPNNAASLPALEIRHDREISAGIVNPPDETQERPDSPRSRSCSMSLASNSEERQSQQINQTDRRPLIHPNCNELTVAVTMGDTSNQKLIYDRQKPPITIASETTVREEDASVSHHPTDSGPRSTGENKTPQSAGCAADRKSVRFGLPGPPVKRVSEQPAYPAKRPHTSPSTGLVPPPQDASLNNDDVGSRSQCPVASSDHASTKATVCAPGPAHLPAQTGAAGPSVPPKSQYESLPILDARLRLATRTFSYPRNVQEMVLIFCQIGLAHQRSKEWQPNNWPAIGGEEMNRWKHSLERLKKLPDMGFLEDYFQAVKDLGSSHSFQYVPETCGGPGAILLKDCTPLGLVYRPLIKTMRTLCARRRLSATMDELSEAIAASLTKTTPAKLVAGVTSLQTYIEAAERDGIVFVARLSKPNSTELTVLVELTRPWKASQRYSKLFPIDDAKVSLMNYPGPHRAAIEAHGRVLSATKCALCKDMGHFSIECPVPVKSLNNIFESSK